MGLRLRTNFRLWPTLRTGCAALALVVVGASLGACGGGNPAGGLLSNIDKACSARTLSSLEQGLIAVQTASADGGADAASLAAALQQRDPSNRYTTAPPTDVGIVQVVGGGGQPVMLVGVTAPPASSGTPPSYLALWESGGSTLFYLGQQPPQYTTTAPSGPGWSSSPPQA